MARSLFVLTIGPEHLHRSWLRVGDRTYGNPLGRTLARDYGKRVYLVDDILQVENDAQRDARLARLGRA